MKQSNFFKALLLLLFALPVAAIAQNINFPDANFKTALLAIEGIDTNNDGEISEVEAANYTGKINVYNKNIAYLTGVEYFTQIKELNCGSNGLQDLDISHNTALTNLNCSKNQLASLDVSNNKALRVLYCGDNKLKVLDVSQNVALKNLSCPSNPLKNIDVSFNKALMYLTCTTTELKALDVSNNKALRLLYCGDNKLKVLDVSHNTALESLDCYKNQLQILDVSHNKALEQLQCFSNGLQVLDLSQNTALYFLSCSSNHLTNLDVSHNTALKDLYCNKNQLKVLNLSQNKALTYLQCNDNHQLTSLDLSHNTALKNLYCNKNQLKVLNLSHNKALTYLQCNDNHQLTSLDLSHNTALKYLYCYNNQLKVLDVSHNKVLKELNCHSNHLTNLDVRQNTSLTSLFCYSNQLTNLDLSQNKALTKLNCNYNKFPFSSLYNIKSHYTGLWYSSNNELYEAQTQEAGFVLDYSSEVIINGNETVFTWHNIDDYKQVDNSIVKTLGNGQFKFIEPGTYYCKMTNAEFPNTTLKTEEIEITGFVVTFNNWDGSGLKQEIVGYNKAATAPDVPVRTGYTLTGWDVVFNNVTSNLTVTAQYTPIEYTITYNLDGGIANNPASYTIESETIALADAAKEGYKFDGWYANAEFTGDAVTEILSGTTGNIELWAKYNINTYTVTFNNWDSSLLKQETINYGSVATEPTSPARTGYTFSGWDVAFNNVTSDLTVTAQYTAVEYTITYNLDGGITNNPASYIIESETIALADAAKEGYTFDGWYTNAEFTGDAVTEILSGTTGNIELWAKYNINTYTVTFNNWDISLLKQETINYGSAATEPTSPARTGYTFSGWDVAFNNVTSDLTVTAQYTAVEYTITYNLDGGITNNPASYIIESETIALADAAKEGYTFDGWYTNAEFTGEVVTEIPSGTTGNIELWANFNKATAIKTVKDNSVKIYPNPATGGYFIVESKSGRGSVTVYALNGNVALSQTITQTTQTIEIPELPNGIYLVKTETENGVTTKRLVVK